MSAVVFQALNNGGAVTLLWGYVIAALGTICVAVSLAEMARYAPLLLEHQTFKALILTCASPV